MRSNLQFYKPLSCMSLVLNRYRRWKNNLTFNGIGHYRTVARKFSIGGLRGSAGELCVCAGGGLDIIKLTKTPLIYNVSRFNSGGLGALFRELSPPKPPRGDGIGPLYSPLSNNRCKNRL